MYSEAEMSIVIRSLPSIDYNHDIYESIGPQLIGERFQFVVIAILADQLCDQKPIPSLTSNGSGMDLYQGYQFNDYSISLPFLIYPILINLYNCPD